MNGLWNGHMFIESTFMRYGHGRAGIVGITLSSQLMKDLAELRGESDENKA